MNLLTNRKSPSKRVFAIEPEGIRKASTTKVLSSRAAPTTNRMVSTDSRNLLLVLTPIVSAMSAVPLPSHSSSQGRHSPLYEISPSLDQSPNPIPPDRRHLLKYPIDWRIWVPGPIDNKWCSHETRSRDKPPVST